MANKLNIRGLPTDGLKLTYNLLYRLDDTILKEGYHSDIAELLDALDGSRVEAYLVPYEDRSSAFVQLRCGDIISSNKFTPGCLTWVIEFAPFIAACAGKAEPEPSELERLKARVGRIEEALGISEEETAPVANQAQNATAIP